MKKKWFGVAGLLAGILVGTSATSERDSASGGSITAGPAVSISRSEAGIRIEFTGTLQSAVDVRGPWVDVLNATSPFEPEAAGQESYFRTRDSQPQSIFSGESVVALTVTGPFQTNFDKAYAGTPDGIFPPKREKPYFDGMVQLDGAELPVSLRVRGNSSLQECPFPKLKFKVSKEDRAGTPFFDAREVKIGTHCADGGHGNIGRLRDQAAAWREALAYEVMEIAGFTGPRVRRARIEYHDTSPTNEFGSTGWVLTRHALLLDDIEVVAERLDGRALSDEEITALHDVKFDSQLITDLLLLHALLGNWDFRLSPAEGLWNTDVIELPDLSLLPVAGDFDLASWVTEFVRLSVPRDYHPELGDVERQALYTVGEIRRDAGEGFFLAGKERFENRRAEIEARINTAELDEPGRTNALRHVSAFYSALAPEKH